MLKVERTSSWEEIEIGEIFATEGCWDVLCKVSENKALFLASDTDYFEELLGEIILKEKLCPNVYKLTKETQECWKE